VLEGRRAAVFYALITARSDHTQRKDEPGEHHWMILADLADAKGSIEPRARSTKKIGKKYEAGTMHHRRSR
jgi:hypothetical protein